MAYEKRVCVLKQIKKGFSADGGTLNGAIYAERLGEELTVTPRVMGLAPLTGGRYALALSLGGQTFVFELRGSESLKLEKAPSLGGGFAALLCYVRGEPEAVAFGKCGSCTATAQQILASFDPPKEKKKRIPNPLPPVEPLIPMPNAPLAPTVPLPDNENPEKEETDHATSPVQRYDDEAIAASDYYGAADEYEQAAPADRKKEKAKKAGRGADQNDGAAHPFLDTEGTLTYYNSIRDRLDEAFEKFPDDGRLTAIFPHSRWVKGEGALLGIVYREGIPKYLCVAVESDREIPSEMQNNCVFVPKDHFTQDAGFYVVFQDADTGAYVKVQES